MSTVKPKKLCMVASGGDAPGMNACMEAMFNYATHLGYEMYVAIKGYDGLVKNNIVRATREKCNGISHISGCVFRCGRSPEFATTEGFARAIDTVKKHDFAALIVIGGNGTFKGISSLKKAGINVIGIPATIDNDVFFTRNSLGFSSACEAITQNIDMIKATMQTNERNYIVQVMGRDCSEIALNVGVASFANVIDISENRHSPQYVADMFIRQREKGNMSCLCITQENRPYGDAFLEQVQQAAGDKGIRLDHLGYFQRGATPSCRDRYLGASYGVMAIHLVIQNTWGVVIGLINDEFRTMDIDAANRVKPKFNMANYGLINKIANR
jgi:6-phosphofructokinase 1